jgi:hypothetical protein
MKRVLTRWGRFVTTTLSRTLTHTTRLPGKLRLGKRRGRETHVHELLQIATLERDQLAAECEYLVADRDRIQTEAQEFVQYADAENQRLKAENETLRQTNDRLAQDYEDLQLHSLELEEQVEYITAYLNADASNADAIATPSEADNDEAIALERQYDFSGYSLALVGGHPTTRQSVLKELVKTYGLNVKNCVEIPPFTEASTNSNKVRAKISRCDLVVIITGYMGHGLTKIVYDLKSAGAIAGEVLMLNCRGKSGVVREISNYFNALLDGGMDQSPLGT